MNSQVQGCGQIQWSARAPIVVQPFHAALCRLESLHHNWSVAHKIWPHPRSGAEGAGATVARY